MQSPTVYYTHSAFAPSVLFCVYIYIYEFTTWTRSRLGLLIYFFCVVFFRCCHQHPAVRLTRGGGCCWVYFYFYVFRIYIDSDVRHHPIFTPALLAVVDRSVWMPFCDQANPPQSTSVECARNVCWCLRASCVGIINCPFSHGIFYEFCVCACRARAWLSKRSVRASASIDHIYT